MKRLLVLCIVLVLSSQAAAQQPPMADRVLAREILKELVEIRSTQEDGTARAAEAVIARLAAAGFPKEDLQILTSEGKVANVVARFRGRNPGVDQRAEKHVAADAGGTINVGDLHGEHSAVSNQQSAKAQG